MSTGQRRRWSAERPLRIAIADDSPIWITGLRAELADENVDVVYTEGTGTALLARLDAGEVPDLVVMDIDMPPDGRDSGVRATRALRERGHTVPVLVMSQMISEAEALALVRAELDAVGYIGKGGNTTRERLLDAFARLVRGEMVMDEALVAKVMARPRAVRRMADLTEQQRRVLALMAEGHSDQSIAQSMFLDTRTVQGHVSGIFRTLDLPQEKKDNRRVLAALLWLTARAYGEGR